MSKSESESKEAPIPNILIINIKTRIPDHFSIFYKPSMTLPKETGKHIYFDPLIMYNLKAVKTNEFFDKNKFETMMNRILSNFFTMQPKRVSLDQGIIENNILVTLHALFGSGKLFYIDNKPYTILDFKWDNKWTTETNYEQSGGEEIHIHVHPDSKPYKYTYKKKSAIKITVELELYPGTNPSLKARSNVLCERKFENIRKSYANLMGYEYRPASTKYARKGGKRRQRQKQKYTRKNRAKN